MTERSPATAATQQSATRIESDGMGDIEIEGSRLWGAQTERSIRNFPIGRTRYVWGRSVIRSLGSIKHAAAIANRDMGVLDGATASLIIDAAAEVVRGELDDHFPLVVFQTGSGTQTNMNANEVIANRANQLHGAELGSKRPVHPNDHVNASQSSNDVFPTVMHLSILMTLSDRLYPSLDSVDATLGRLADEHHDLVKVGRTHLQDATPVTVGQEIESWRSQLRSARGTLERNERSLAELAIGGTATGTGLNAPPGFGQAVARELRSTTGFDVRAGADRLALTAAHDAVVDVSAALRTIAGASMKMANDIRWLASGPRNGIGELRIPANEPGSSIMPGKVNPTQAEALTMVAVHVFGNDTAVAFAGSQGNFELNAFKPLMLHRTLDSIELLADALASFDERCLSGLEPDRVRIAEHLDTNLALGTALAPHVGYDRAAEITKRAHTENMTLRAAAGELGVSGDDFDAWVDPTEMALGDPAETTETTTGSETTGPPSSTDARDDWSLPGRRESATRSDREPR